jgi:hypothetical protein
MLAHGFIAAFIVGWIMYGIEHSLHFFLIWLFPLVAGGIIGFVSSLGVSSGKIRNTTVAMLIGAASGLFAFGVHQYFGYQAFRAEARDMVQTMLTEDSTPAELSTPTTNPFAGKRPDVAVDLYLTQATGSSGFLGYLNLEAQQGVEISSRRLHRVNTGSGGFWFMFFLEALMLSVISGFLAKGSAEDPFDEGSQQWYASAVPITRSGADTTSLSAMLKRKQFEPAGAELAKPPYGYPIHELRVRTLPNVKTAPVVLEFYDITLETRKDKDVEVSRMIERGMISGADFENFMNAYNEVQLKTEQTKPSTPASTPVVTPISAPVRSPSLPRVAAPPQAIASASAIPEVLANGVKLGRPTAVSKRD